MRFDTERCKPRVSINHNPTHGSFPHKRDQELFLFNLNLITHRS